VLDDRGEASPTPCAGRPLYRRPASSKPISRSSRLRFAQPWRRLIPARLAPAAPSRGRIRFHLASVDLRQSSDRMKTLKSWMSVAARVRRLCALDEAGRRKAAAPALSDPRPCGFRASLRATHGEELRHLRGGAGKAPSPFGRRAGGCTTSSAYGDGQRLLKSSAAEGMRHDAPQRSAIRLSVELMVRCRCSRRSRSAQRRKP